MKNFTKLVFLFAMMLVANSEFAFAGDTYYYAQLKTVVATSSNAKGTVYASIINADDTKKYDASYESEKQDAVNNGSGVEKTFYAFAKGEDGYSFNGWSSIDDASADRISTNNPYEVTVKTSTTGGGTNITTLYAHFEQNPTVTLTFKQPVNGSYTAEYKTEGTTITMESSSDETSKSSDETIYFTATPATGYKFLGWAKIVNGEKSFFSGESSCKQSFSEEAIIVAEFVSEDLPIFKNKQTGYLSGSLVAMCDAAKEKETDETIVLVGNGTLAAGTYEIPENVTLLIPMDANYETMTKAKSKYNTNEKPVEYRRLTLSKGSNITLYGSICLAAMQEAQTNGWGSDDASPGSVKEKYGSIDMSSGGHITVKDGGNLYAFGFIFGAGDQSSSGSILVEDGGIVYENLVLTDMHGGNGSAAIVNGFNASNNYDLFPFHQYYIQNIEPKITIQYGGSAKALFNIRDSEEGGKQEYITVIGTNDDALFTMSNGSIEKWYDATVDRQCYAIKGNTTLNEMTVNAAASIALDSKKFLLPLTNNLDIRIEGDVTVNLPNKVEMLPGCKISIGENAVVDVQKDLVVFDYHEWDFFSFDGSENYIRPMLSNWAPGIVFARNRTSKEALGNATIVVNGTLQTTGNGVIYTTETGASIISNGAGQIVLNGATPVDGKKVYEVKGTYGASSDGPKVGSYGGKTVYATPINCTSVQLKNSDDSFTLTEKAVPGTTFKYKNGKWLAYVPEESEEAVIDDGHELVIKEQSQVDNFESVQVLEGGTVKVETTVETPVNVDNGGTITVEAGKSANITTLALNASPAEIFKEDEKNYTGESSQVFDEGTLTATNAYIDIHMDPRGTMNHLLWYTFAVPFNVNISSVQKMAGNGTLSPAVLDTNYRVFTYNGANRASGEGETWEQVTTSTDGGKFIPGKFYLVEFNSNSYNTFRFTKADGNLNNAADLPIAANVSTNDPKDGGWNAIANTALKSAKIEIAKGVTEAQVFNPVSRKFETVVLSNTTFAIATAMFIQATAASTAKNSAVKNSSPAPARLMAPEATENVYGTYTLRISKDSNKYTDQLLFSASEDASDKYVIGKDLTKMFMGKSTVAELWINDYNSKLTKNQAVMTNNIAEASLTLYAPAAGEYNVYLKDIPEDATIYLLKSGVAIAELNEGAAVVTLASGENTQYGLRIHGKRSPSVVTSIDEALVKAAQTGVGKYIWNNRVIIVREGKVYDVNGNKIQ